MSPILEAINNALYRPQDSTLGITAGVLGQSAPALYNPYASTGSNLGYVGGSALLAGLLGGVAKHQANQRNIAQLGATQQLLNATPEQRAGLVAQNSRLGPILAALQAREEDQRAGLVQKMQERTAMMPFNLQEEQAKGMIGLLGDQGVQLSPQRLQQLANQDLDYSTLGVQTPGQLRLAEKRAEIPIDQEATLAQIAVTNPIRAAAIKKQLEAQAGALSRAPGEELTIPTDIYAGILEEDAGLPASPSQPALTPFEQKLQETGGSESTAAQLYTGEIARGQKLEDEGRKAMEEKVLGMARTDQLVAEMEGAILRAKETGGFPAGLQEPVRKQRLLLEAEFGSEEAKKRLGARKDIEAVAIDIAADVRKNFPGPVTNWEMVQYMKKAPLSTNLQAENLAVLDRYKKAAEAMRESLGYIRGLQDKGMSYQEAMDRYNKLEIEIPMTVVDKDGERQINPARLQAYREDLGVPAPSPVGTIVDDDSEYRQQLIRQIMGAQ